MPSPTPPFHVVTSKTAGGNGLPNIYVADADGKKVAAVWGPENQRWDTAYLFAAAPALVAALEELLSSDREICATLHDRDANDRAINRQIAAERRAGEALVLARCRS